MGTNKRKAGIHTDDCLLIPPRCKEIESFSLSFYICILEDLCYNERNSRSGFRNAPDLLLYSDFNWRLFMESTDFSSRTFPIPVLLHRFLLGCLMVLLFSGTVRANDDQTAEVSVQQTPLQQYGMLRVTGSSLTDQYGQPVQLRGVSTMNIVRYPEYITEETFTTLRDIWNINVIRLVMYTADDGGYCVTDDAGRESLKELLTAGVQYAYDLGLYVIIDWNICSDSDPNLNKDSAAAFFSDISYRLQGYDNVIYEICDSPGSDVSWNDISSYAADNIDMIRINVPSAVSLVGTPSGSQDLDAAVMSPIERDNILYSLHFYTPSDHDDLFLRTTTALQSGLPVFVSEFGAGFSGDSGEFEPEEAEEWLELLDYYQVSYVIWNLSHGENSCSLLTSDCTLTDSWDNADLTSAAGWYIRRMNETEQTYAVSYSVATNEAVEETAWTLSNGCTVEVAVNSSWSDGAHNFCEYNITIGNSTQNAVNGWRIRMTWSDPVSLMDSWSCDIGGYDNSRLIIPLDYNKVIGAGSSIDFGLIVYSTSIPYLTNISEE